MWYTFSREVLHFSHNLSGELALSPASHLQKGYLHTSMKIDVPNVANIPNGGK
jgi:hypothetical protein